MSKHVTKIITVFSDGSVEISTPNTGIQTADVGGDTPPPPPKHP